MNKFKIYYLFNLLLAIFLVAGSTFAQDFNKKENRNLSKTLVKDSRAIDVNQIEAYFDNTGQIAESPSVSNAFYYPKGQTNQRVVYTGGLWILGKLNRELRSAACQYGTEFQPGMILQNGEPDDNTLEKYRIFKFDHNNPPTQEAIDQGCPSELLGDQMLYCVYNDYASHAAIYTLPPIGIEVQQTVFGFDREGPLGNVIFIRYRLINKNKDSIPLEDTYLGIFLDPDIGDMNDDNTGCDPDLDLAFAFNGDNNDADYGNQPPCVGSDFFQGPLVPSSGDTAYLPDGTMYPDQKILGMSAYFAFIKTGAISGMDDPATKDPTGAQEAYYFVQGFRGNGLAWVDPDGNETKFPFSGDPSTGSGWLLKSITDPVDVRMGNACGPFTLEPNTPQDVVVGLVVGQGKDYIGSVDVMKYYDIEAQAAYDNNFQIPPPPPKPQVTITQMDEEAILNWDKAADSYKYKGYKFEGYNVWQAPSAGGPWTCLATYDVVNNITTIWEETFDFNLSTFINQPTEFGKDTGIKHDFYINRDFLNDAPLVNGRKYFFSITSYAYNPNATIKVLRSSKDVLTVIPQRPVLDEQFNSDYGQVVTAAHQGGSQGEVTAVVTNPALITGHDYTVTFYTKDNQTVWKLTDATLGNDLLVDQTGTTHPDPIDGLLFTVTGPEGEGLEGIYEVANLHFSYPLPEGQRDENGAEYGGNDCWLDWGMPDDSTSGLNAFKLSGQGVTAGTIHPLENDYEIRFVEPSEYSWAERKKGSQIEFVKAPFQLWDIGKGTPNDPSDDIQMVCYSLEYGDGDLTAWDNPNGTNTDTQLDEPCSPRIYAYYPTHTYADIAAAAEAGDFSTADEHIDKLKGRAFSRIVYITKKPGHPAPGTVIRFVSIKPNTSEDTFIISTAALAKKKNAEIAKKRLDEINVFPNPYFAQNKAETDFYVQFVTFNNLPENNCSIRIFSLSGQLVKTIKHDNGTPFEKWYLVNERNLPVASGMYIVVVETKFGNKILKLAVINREQRFKHM